MDGVERLFPLFGLDCDNKDDREFFSKITDLGVIAGGSMVYALKESLHRKTVGDVDLYILSSDVFAKQEINWYVNINSHWDDIFYRTYERYVSYKSNCAGTDMSAFSETVKLLCSKLIDPVVTTMETGDYSRCKFVVIIQMIKSKNAKPIQVILTRYKDVMSLIEDFDMSYVKCAFHKNKVWITDDALQSHKTGIIHLIQSYKKTRLDKMIKKGFRCINPMPYYLNSFDVDENCLNTISLNGDETSLNVDLNKRYTVWTGDDWWSYVTYHGCNHMYQDNILVKCVKSIQDSLRWWNGGCGYNVDYPTVDDKYHTCIILQIDPLGIPELNHLIADYCNGYDMEYICDYLDTYLQKRCSTMCQGLSDMTKKIRTNREE